MSGASKVRRWGQFCERTRLNRTKVMRGLAIGVLVLASFDTAFADSAQDCAQTQDVDLRIAGCTALIRSSSTDLGAYHNRGVAYWTKGEYSLAIADYDHVLRFDPKQAGTWNNRGLVYSSLKQYVRAAIDFNEALRLDPNQPMARKNLAAAQTEIDKITDQEPG
jgi:Flp pilus assembly protein TadD